MFPQLFTRMQRKLILAATILGSTSIVLGAFGAHALKKIMTTDMLQTFEVGVRYQMYHALFLFLVAVLVQINDHFKKIILTTTTLGVLFFSGSIYLLSTNELTSVDFSFLGPITPIGGLLLMVSWVLVFYGFNKKTTKK
jgi:uncharacterized membrane protein YgdD (TMEM256/DUF423 family)